MKLVTQASNAWYKRWAKVDDSAILAGAGNLPKIPAKTPPKHPSQRQSESPEKKPGNLSKFSQNSE